jgi:hypothetical protein
MNRNQRRAVERRGLRAFKGKKVQSNKESINLSGIKKKILIKSFISSIMIGLFLSLAYLYSIR